MFVVSPDRDPAEAMTRLRHVFSFGAMHHSDHEQPILRMRSFRESSSDDALHHSVMT